MRIRKTATTTENVDLISVATIKDQVRIGDEMADDSIKQLIAQAVVFVEGVTGLILGKSTWALTVKDFPECRKPILFPGLDSSVMNLSYISSQALTYEGIKSFPRGDTEVFPADGANWPNNTDFFSVTLAGRRGVDAGSLPEDLQSAVILEVMQLYDGFEAYRGQAITNICSRYQSIP